MKKLVLGSSVLVLGIVAGNACGGSDSSTDLVNGDAGAGNDASSQGDVAQGDDGSGEGGNCDAAKSPAQDPCVVSDAMGVFVATTGSDSAQGTMSAPFKTIGRGIQAAKQANKRVYICAGTYDEKV